MFSEKAPKFKEMSKKYGTFVLIDRSCSVIKFHGPIIKCIFITVFSSNQRVYWKNFHSLLEKKETKYWVFCVEWTGL